MQRTKNSYEKLLIQRLKTNCFSRKRAPSPVKLFTLDRALIKVNTTLLAKEIAYVLSTTFSYRLMMEEKYVLAFNSLPLKNWDSIAVVAIDKKISNFSDIVCVDLKNYNAEFRINNPVFVRLILSELNKIRRG